MKLSAGFALVACLLLCSQANSATLKVKIPADYFSEASVPLKMRENCALDRQLGEAVLQRAQATLPKVSVLAGAPDNDEELQLSLTILAMSGTGGGGWSGSKMMVVKADLANKQGRIATVTKSQVSKHLIGIASGSCGLLAHVANLLAEDFGQWLKLQPVLRAPE